MRLLRHINFAAAAAAAGWTLWLGFEVAADRPGAARALGACLITALIFWRQRSRPRATVQPKHPLARYGLLIACIPIEGFLPRNIDVPLQRATAAAAGFLLNHSGLTVQISPDGPPALLGPAGLVVYVTALCAGLPTLLALWTLGLVLAEFNFDDLRTQLLFTIGAPIMGLAANVLRVAISAHAANLWAGGSQEWLWNVAHDVIGYGTFGLGYGALLLAVGLLRRHRSRATPATATLTTAGQSVASPQRT